MYKGFPGELEGRGLRENIVDKSTFIIFVGAS